MISKIAVLSWLFACLGALNFAFGQSVSYVEYNLPNGLHVVLHQDHSAADVAVSVMYHVGSKNEVPGRTGFAHFFEHLLFEGSENIKRGEFMKIVAAHGGQDNANTTQDRTFYFEELPSNELQLGLWLESERMMHPVINEIGVNTQREVVKEEKRMRLDNSPYGHIFDKPFSDLFKVHPYRWQTIGSMEDIDRAKLSEFKAFFKKYYLPNNAVLCISGDFDIVKTKQLINSYFAPIPAGEPVIQPNIQEAPITHEIIDTTYDNNIKIPAILTVYRTPGGYTKDATVLGMLSSLLAGQASSRLNVKLVDQKKTALEVASFNYGLEDFGLMVNLALPNGDASLNGLLKDIDDEVKDLQTNLISEKDYEKLLNQAETAFLNTNSRNIGIAENLANGYTFCNHNTGYVNGQLLRIRSVYREDIRNAAIKYLNSNSRAVIYYLPGK